MQILSVAASLQAGTFLEYTRSIGWEVDEAAVVGIRGRPLGRFVDDLCAKAPMAIRDRVHEDFERVDRLAREKSGTAIRDAAGPPGPISAALEALGSDHNRALWLLLHHPDLFERAEHAVAFSSRVGAPKKWLGYHLKPFSRSWTPDELHLNDIATRITTAVREREGEERHVKVELFERPATSEGWEGQRQWQFSISISQRETHREQWVNADLEILPVVENRRMEIAVTPHAKTVQAVRDAMDAELFREIVDVFASTALQQTGPLEPFQHRDYQLKHLKARPIFDLHPEHGIAGVKITKLVVGAAGGTTTYWSGSRGEADAYDVAAAATGRKADNAIGRRPILAVAVRVEFKPRAGKRGKVVSFEISLPNKCNLREENEYARLIIERYLTDWGFLPVPEAGDARAA